MAGGVRGLASVFPIELRTSPPPAGSPGANRLFWRTYGFRHKSWLVRQYTGKPPRTYDLATEAEALLAAATAVSVEDSSEIVQFVGTWGSVIDDAHHPRFDGEPLEGVRAALTLVQTHARRLAAMQGKRWRSPDLPPRSEVLVDADLDTLWWIESKCGFSFVRRIWKQHKKGSYGNTRDWKKQSEMVAPKIPAKFWPRLYWNAFANNLDWFLGDLRPMLRIDRDTGLPTPYFVTRTLKDTMFLTLWQKAIEPDTVGCLCAGCNGVFFRSRTNPRRIYCSPTCKVRVNVRKHRARRRRRSRSSSTTRTRT